MFIPALSARQLFLPIFPRAEGRKPSLPPTPFQHHVTPFPTLSLRDGVRSCQQRLRRPLTDLCFNFCPFFRLMGSGGAISRFARISIPPSRDWVTIGWWELNEKRGKSERVILVPPIRKNEAKTRAQQCARNTMSQNASNSLDNLEA